MDGGQITHGELVKAGGHRPVLVDAALDRVPLPIHLTVECRGPAPREPRLRRCAS